MSGVEETEKHHLETIMQTDKKTYEDACDIANAVLELAMWAQSKCTKTPAEFLAVRAIADKIMHRATGWTADELEAESASRIGVSL